MDPKKGLWTERYRPQKLEELILPNRITKKFEKGLYNNFLLHGSPGTGKTSSAKILAAMDGFSSIYINCSSESGVDNVRNKITEWCSTLSVNDGGKRQLKVVILDELDGVSDQYLKALRGTIEQFEKSARFVATCNYINKIPDNIQSRFECFDFDLLDEAETKEVELKYMKRIFSIIKTEGMEIEKEALVELTKRKFPDLRSIIQTLQGYYAADVKKITLEDIKKYQGVFKQLYEHIFSPVTDETKNLQFVIQNYANSADAVIGALGLDFIEFIQLEHPLKMNKIGEIFYEVNKHSYESRFAIDPLITVLSLIYRLQVIVK